MCHVIYEWPLLKALMARNIVALFSSFEASLIILLKYSKEGMGEILLIPSKLVQIVNENKYIFISKMIRKKL